MKTETKNFSDCFIPLFIESNILQSLKVNLIVFILLFKFHIPFNRKTPGVLQNLFVSFARLILCFEAINKAVMSYLKFLKHLLMVFGVISLHASIIQVTTFRWGEGFRFPAATLLYDQKFSKSLPINRLFLFFNASRSRFWTLQTSKMERFAKIVNGFPPS